MGSTTQNSPLLQLPPELRNTIWALVAAPLPVDFEFNCDEQPVLGLINTCEQTARELAPHLFPRSKAGEVLCLTIRITTTCRKDQWITIAASHSVKSADFPAPRYIHVNHMDNPVFDELRDAEKIENVFVEFRGPWFPADAPWYSPHHVPRKTSGFRFMMIDKNNRGCQGEPILDTGKFWRQWNAPFLCHWAKANDVARLLGSLKAIGTLNIKFIDWEKNYMMVRQRILPMYWDAFPFGGQWKRLGVPELLLTPFNRGETIPNLVDEQRVLTRFGALDLSRPTREDEPLECDPHPDRPLRGSAMRLDRLAPLFFYRGGLPSAPEAGRLNVDFGDLEDRFLSLLEEVGEEHYDTWALQQHGEATRHTSLNNFFQRIAHRVNRDDSDSPASQSSKAVRRTANNQTPGPEVPIYCSLATSNLVQALGNSEGACNLQQSAVLHSATHAVLRQKSADRIGTGPFRKSQSTSGYDLKLVASGRQTGAQANVQDSHKRRDGKDACEAVVACLWPSSGPVPKCQLFS
ncbi:hypothetical protein CCUS01_01452 [Colletotrichum cuscutae]|uniref:Uncharacterized protein n=1 Tax=Colletotrichum cuscutae TaxID=1209917 RepID=A0AAI9UNP3_9PEZI|nr:hypothetical protein CCUS01_01452 [Colletotrichum cuscutae]